MRVRPHLRELESLLLSRTKGMTAHIVSHTTVRWMLDDGKGVVAIADATPLLADTRITIADAAEPTKLKVMRRLPC